MPTRAGGIDCSTERPLTFGGRSSVVVPAGAPIVSDGVDMPVRALETISVTLYILRDTGPSVTHPDGIQTAYFTPAGSGNFVSAEQLPAATTLEARFFITRIDIIPDDSDAQAIVAIGDSITDGNRSTLNANKRWTDRLAERLAGRAHGRTLSIVNAGLSGNRLLHDIPHYRYGPCALARFDRDVISVPGVAHVVVFEGINDIGQPQNHLVPEQEVTAQDLINGYQQLISRAHSRNIKVVGGTLTPFGGYESIGYYSEENEAKRQAVNSWIREGGKLDAFVDFDAALRDPEFPSRLQPQYDSGDHLHLSDAGYTALGDAVDLGVFV
jgi:lysophospholipase L1-like esterase